MKQLLGTAVFLALAACASTEPVRTVDGNWMISARVPFSGQSGALEKAISNANDFCRAQGGLVPKLVSNSAKECALHGGCGEAQIVFACAKASP